MVDKLKSEIDTVGNIYKNTQEVMNKLQERLKEATKKPVDNPIQLPSTALYQIIESLLVSPIHKVTIENKRDVDEYTIAYDILMKLQELSTYAITI